MKKMKILCERQRYCLVKEKNGVYSGYIIPPAMGYMERRIQMSKPTDAEAIETFEEMIKTGFLLTESEKLSGFYK